MGASHQPSWFILLNQNQCNCVLPEKVLASLVPTWAAFHFSKLVSQTTLRRPTGPPFRFILMNLKLRRFKGPPVRFTLINKFISYVYKHAQTHTHKHTHTYISIYNVDWYTLYWFMYTDVYVCVYVRMCICTHAYIMYVFTVCVCVCMRAYVCTCPRMCASLYKHHEWVTLWEDQISFVKVSCLYKDSTTVSQFVCVCAYVCVRESDI